MSAHRSATLGIVADEVVALARQLVLPLILASGFAPIKPIRRTDVEGRVAIDECVTPPKRCPAGEIGNSQIARGLPLTICRVSQRQHSLIVSEEKRVTATTRQELPVRPFDLGWPQSSKATCRSWRWLEPSQRQRFRKV